MDLPKSISMTMRVEFIPDHVTFDKKIRLKYTGTREEGKRTFYVYESIDISKDLADHVDFGNLWQQARDLEKKFDSANVIDFDTRFERGSEKSRVVLKVGVYKG